MHVRRNDAGLNNDGRRYTSVSEYLKVGNVQKGDTIVLLTEDASTLEEIRRFHPNYDWKYPERPSEFHARPEHYGRFRFPSVGNTFGRISHRYHELPASWERPGLQFGLEWILDEARPHQSSSGSAINLMGYGKKCSEIESLNF
jgi:hypothetical protein